MSKYWDWLESLMDKSSFWKLLAVVNFVAIGGLAGALLFVYVYSVFASFGLTVFLPIGWTYWYYRTYEVNINE